jgi:hypothetical protein
MFVYSRQSNISKKYIITRSTSNRCSMRVFLAILNSSDMYFVSCWHTSVVGRPWSVILCGDKTCFALHFQQSQCSVFGKNVSDLNTVYVPRQISIFIRLHIFKERKIAIWLSRSLLYWTNPGQNYVNPATSGIYMQCELTIPTEKFQRQSTRGPSMLK